VLGLLGLLSTVLAFGPSPQNSEGWGVVFDCGSSGTRAHYFKWPSERPIRGVEEVKPPNMENALRVEPGISQFAVGQGCEDSTDGKVCDQVVVDPDTFKVDPAVDPAVCKSKPCQKPLVGDCCLSIEEYIQPLLDQAARSVPAAAQHTTKLRMRATAGMRLIDADKQKAIYDRLITVASQTAFDFDASDAYTIAGNYEGMFGWLAVQELTNWEKSVGWLDLGGASTQIAFQPKDGVITEEAVEVEIFSTKTDESLANSRIYSTSYMRSGQAEAQKRIAHYLYDRSPNKLSVEDPCLNPGYSVTTYKEFPGSNFTGSGNYTQCSAAIVSAIIHQEYECLQDPCAVAGNYQPKVEDMTFFAGSAFFFLVNGLNLSTADTTTAQIAAAGSDYCAKEYLSIPEEDRKHAVNYCFSSAYIPAMLDAYGIARNSTAVTYANGIGDVGLEWALGCQVHANADSASKHRDNIAQPYSFHRPHDPVLA